MFEKVDHFSNINWTKFHLTNTTVEEYKKITNYENTKKVLKEIKLEMPEVPNINEISKFSIKRDEKILEQIIKPKDNLIKELYQDNLSLHKELSKQSKVVDEAVKYQKEREKLLADNEELHNTVKNLEHKYKIKSNNLDFDFNNRKKELDLHKVIDKFYFAIDKFIEWICQKFSLGDSKELVKTFENDTNISLDPQLQIKKEEREKEWDLEL